DSFYYYGHAWDRNPNYCYISGFTFTNCFAGYSVKGVAVFSDIVAHRSGVFNGGAIYTHAGGYNVRNCDFQNCMAGNCGGGIFVEPWNPNVDNDPHALWRLPYVENCRFNECKAANNAYDIFLVFPKLWNINATAKVSDCTFVHSDSIKLCSTIGVGGSLDGVSKSMMILGNEVINQNNTASQSALVGSAVAGGKLWVFIPLLVVISGAVVGVVLYRKKKTTNK
ncbi:MAG: hypothetical protein MJ072_02055, partial [Clostridia bacterium]|nr:hypothetical protein [Clostridia bacterium]